MKDQRYEKLIRKMQVYFIRAIRDHNITLMHAYNPATHQERVITERIFFDILGLEDEVDADFVQSGETEIKEGRE